jgi:glycosyltransferase involved in cell wall biosynthesis
MAMTPAPEVSVVIPTIGRPELERAVSSALGQEHVVTEIIIVADGELAADRIDRLERTGRVRVLRPGARLGGGAARNLGIEAAEGPWIALLDDDDWWCPNKLSTQLHSVRHEDAVVLSCSIRATDRSDVWPHESPDKYEHLSEFYFLRRGWRQGNYLQTSTLVVPTWLARACPFDPSLPILQDIDWVLRLTGEHGARIGFIEAPLSFYEVSSAQSVSRVGRPAECLAWGQRNRHLLTERAYAGFLLTVVAERAARGFNMAVFSSAVRLALRTKAARPRDLIMALAFLGYRPWVRKLRASLRSRTFRRPSSHSERPT